MPLEDDVFLWNHYWAKNLCGRRNNVDSAEQEEPKQSIIITTIHICTVICGWWKTLIPLFDLTRKLVLINEVGDIVPILNIRKLIKY